MANHLTLEERDRIREQQQESYQIQGLRKSNVHTLRGTTFMQRSRELSRREIVKIAATD